MSDHVLCDYHIIVHLSIVNLKDQTNKIREYGRASGLRLDGWYFLARSPSDDREATHR